MNCSIFVAGKIAQKSPGVFAGVGAAFVALIVYAGKNVPALAVGAGKEMHCKLTFAGRVNDKACIIPVNAPEFILPLILFFQLYIVLFRCPV